MPPPPALDPVSAARLSAAPSDGELRCRQHFLQFPEGDIAALTRIHHHARRTELEAHRTVRRPRHSSAGVDDVVVRTLAINGQPAFDTKGGFLDYRGTGTDETDLMAAQRAAQDASDLLHDAMESLLQGLAIFDGADRLIMCNQAFRELYPACAAVLQPGITYAGFLRHAIDRGCFPDMAGQQDAWLAARLAQHRGNCGSTELALADDRWLLVTERRTSRGGVVAVHIDITGRRQIERQLVQAVKMEAIGNLTGGLAHDFNNLLAIIIGNLDVLQPILDADAAELVQDALEAALRGADLTHRLLAFARRQPLRPEPLDVNALVGSLTRLLGRLLGHDVEIALRLGPGLGAVLADPAQLEAALTNLATNARDAMPRGGRLTIVTGNRVLPAEPADAPAELAPGSYVVIEVADTGSGIEPELIPRIFEPFFTTKQPGKGTGLGLSMVFGFVKQSGGHVTVDSEPGQGTAFRLWFPCISTVTERAEGNVLSLEPQGGSETILAVEDSPELRRVVSRQLTRAGYHVLSAENAAAALALVDSGAAFDLLLSDVVMPGGISGEELARQVQARRPAIRVLLTSGFPDIDGRAAVRLPFRLLPKPYRSEDLLGTVRAVLDG